MGHVCVFRHALALDEFRVKFLPEYAYGGEGPAGKNPTCDLKEVWFAGSHSDMYATFPPPNLQLADRHGSRHSGGGNTENTSLDHFGPALRWMTYQAIVAELLIERFKGEWKTLESHSSMTFIWRLIECFPMRQPIYGPQREGTRDKTTSW